MRKLTFLGAAVLLGCHDPSSPSTPGRIVWHHEFEYGGPLVPAFDANAAYFGGLQHEILALDKHDGHVLWSARTQAAVDPAYPDVTFGTSLVVAADVVAIGDIDIYAYRRSTGAPAWTFIAPDADETGRSKLISDGSTIYAGSFRGRAFAIDAATGQMKWMTSLGEPDSTNAAFDPVLRNGTLFFQVSTLHVGPTTGALYALSASDGHILWHKDLVSETASLGSADRGGAVVAGGVVINPQADGRIFAFDAETGAVRWIAPAVDRRPDDHGPDQRALATNGSVVVATSTATDYVVGIDVESGAEVWRVETIGSAEPGLSTDGASAYFATNYHLLVGLNVANGAERWSPFKPTNPLSTWWTAPAVDHQLLYVSATDGFYAIEAP
jgi:outer membrane protein assembly factor BamB